jgi:hypothetical protein
MTGHSIFTYEAPQTRTQETVTITEQDYENWKKQFTADALRGQRYGQSFANWFGITDNLLFFTTEIEWCENYIRDKYIARR